MLEANLVRSFVFHDEQFSLITVLQFSNTGTDSPLFTKNASVVLEAVKVDVLILDLGGPPTLAVYAVQFKLGYKANFALIEYVFVEKYISYSNCFETIILSAVGTLLVRGSALYFNKGEVSHVGLPSCSIT